MARLVGEGVSVSGECRVFASQLLVVSQEAREDELARWVSREWLGDREQSAEPVRVGRDDHDQAASRLRGRVLGGEGGILADDRLLELPQGRARLDAKLVDEQAPCLAVDLERLGLSA
jgi:hypothetical protein